MPVIVGVVYNLREVRVKHFLLLNLDKSCMESDALSHIIAIQQAIKPIDHKENVTLIGIVNLHVLECQDLDCPCKDKLKLFDVTTGKFSKRNVGYHKDMTFLKHFTKKLYEDLVNKFNDSAVLSISFAAYLFDVMGNVHAALVELSIAAKKKPSIQQEFAIYRIKANIEDYIREESESDKDVYTQLTSVVEFEGLLAECQKAIEKVANLQIEFWSQIVNQLPDLNMLHDLSNSIYEATRKTKSIWNKINCINSHYSKALNFYGNYMLELKNHNQMAYELFEKYINSLLS